MATVARCQAGPALDPDRTYDVVVVGGGIVGLATAREIAGRFPGKSICVLEKEAEVATHQTGHNSGVIHAGLYYAPGSTMARCCVRGAALTYKYLEAKGLPVERTGKLVCAPTAAEAHHLPELLRIGTTNGVEDLRILDADEVRALEPAVQVHGALYSPNTGIADYGAMARAMAADVLDASPHNDIKLQYEVRKVELLDGGEVQVLGAEPGQKGPLVPVRAKRVITCAGLHADKVAAAAGGEPNPKVVTFRGTYWQLKAEHRDLVRMNVYPTPSGGGIPVGVHFTPTVNERRGHGMIVGPGACVCFDREAYGFFDVSIKHLWMLATHPGLWRFALSNWDLAITEMYRDLNKHAFLDQARKLIPSLTDDMVEESFAGVMSQVILPDGSMAIDFIYERNLLGGTTLHVRSAPTPACTAALALAEEIVDQASADFEWGAGRGKASEASPFWK